MLQIQFISREDEGKAPLYGPVFCCDWCKQQITDAQMALYKWQNDENRQPKQETFVILHKGTCDEAHNRACQADEWPWNEFYSLLGLLVRNSNREGREDFNLWSAMVEYCCPYEDLLGVRKTSAHLIIFPEDRPPSLNDLA